MAAPKRCEHCGFIFFKSSQYSGHRNACTAARPWDGMPNRRQNTQLVGAVSVGTATRKRVKTIDPVSGAVRTVTSKIGHPHAGDAMPRLRIAAPMSTPAPPTANQRTPLDALVAVAPGPTTTLDLTLLLRAASATPGGRKRARADVPEALSAAKRARTEPPLQGRARDIASDFALRMYHASSASAMEDILGDIGQSLVVLRRARRCAQDLIHAHTRADGPRITEMPATPTLPVTPQ
jgi:hypothetical protein